MRAITKAQKLLARANNGDADARVQLDKLLTKYGTSEADIPTSRKRGRPRLLDRTAIDGLCHQAADFAPSQVTQRTKENFYFYANALHIISPSVEHLKRWAWLLRPNERGETHSRKTIMSQLGRIGNERAREIFADRLCELKPTTTHKALRLLREWEENRRLLLAMKALGSDGADALSQGVLDDAARRACYDDPPKHRRNTVHTSKRRGRETG